jgi:hypothetical protein
MVPLKFTIVHHTAFSVKFKKTASLGRQKVPKPLQQRFHKKKRKKRKSLIKGKKAMK